MPPENQLEQFVPESLQPVRKPAPEQPSARAPGAPRRNNTNTVNGAVLIVIGSGILFWLFVAKPHNDGMARFEDAVTGSRIAPTESSSRHTELIGTIVASTFILLGGLIFGRGNK